MSLTNRGLDTCFAKDLVENLFRICKHGLCLLFLQKQRIVKNCMPQNLRNISLKNINYKIFGLLH